MTPRPPYAGGTRKAKRLTLKFGLGRSNVSRPASPYTWAMIKLGVLRVSIVTLAMASVLSLAAAQIDPRAQALLDGLLAGASGQAVHSVDQSTVTTIYVAGADPQEVRGRTIIDYDNRRMVVENELGEGLSSRMVLKDGKVTMTMAGMPFALPVPPGTAEQLEAVFDEPTSVALRDGDTATFDGPVDYGVLQGDQVTYTTTFPGSDTATTIQYVFQGSALAGLHMVSEGSEMVMVYDTPVTSSMLTGANMTSYMLEDGTWNKVSHTLFESVVVNEAIDDSLFE